MINIKNNKDEDNIENINKEKKTTVNIKKKFFTKLGYKRSITYKILLFVLLIFFFTTSMLIFNFIKDTIYNYKISSFRDAINKRITENVNNALNQKAKEESFYQKYIEAKKEGEIYIKRQKCEEFNLDLFYKTTEKMKKIDFTKTQYLNCSDIGKNTDKFSLIGKVSAANILEGINVPEAVETQKTEVIIKKSNIAKTKGKKTGVIVIEKKEKKKQIIKKVKKSYGKEYDKLLKDMYLNDCRITQKTKDHIKKENGHVYAIDIACEIGKSFTVKVPNIRDIYIVTKNSYDKRLGNYIVLKHGKMRFVFAHTSSSLKVGKYVYPKDILGKTNISGISENQHVHFEIWNNDGKANLDIDYKTENTKYSLKLRKQRNWLTKKEKEIKVEKKVKLAKTAKKTNKQVEEKTNENTLLREITDFIISFEGFSPKPYCDNLKKVGKKYVKYCPTKKERYSIGYGTISFYKEKNITQEEGEKRKMAEIKRILPIVDQKCYTSNQKIALSSYIYNTGGNQVIGGRTFKGYVSSCRKKDVVYVMNLYGHGKNLHKRRVAELKKYFN